MDHPTIFQYEIEKFLSMYPEIDQTSLIFLSEYTKTNIDVIFDYLLKKGKITNNEIQLMKISLKKLEKKQEIQELKEIPDITLESSDIIDPKILLQMDEFCQYGDFTEKDFNEKFKDYDYQSYLKYKKRYLRIQYPRNNFSEYCSFYSRLGDDTQIFCLICHKYCESNDETLICYNDECQAKFHKPCLANHLTDFKFICDRHFCQLCEMESIIYCKTCCNGYCKKHIPKYDVYHDNDFFICKKCSPYFYHVTKKEYI